MAVLLFGVTPCAICEQVIEDGEEVVSFPPIFLNELAPQFVLNDASVHKTCLGETPFAPAALRKLAEVERRQGRAKMCTVCGRAVTSPDNYFATGPLSDSAEDRIRPLDWVESHLDCLPRWDGLRAAVSLLEEVNRSAEWEGDVLQRLLDQIASVAPVPTSSS